MTRHPSWDAPLTICGLLRHWRRRHNWALVLAIYVSVALSGLAIQGLFVALGMPVTHIPWFRDLVDRIIMALPFTMLGAPGGAPTGGM